MKPKVAILLAPLLPALNMPEDMERCECERGRRAPG